MKKRWMILLLSLCVAGSMAACGGKKENAKTDTETSGEKQETPEESEESEEDEASDEKASGERIVSVVKDDMENYVTLGDYKGISVSAEVEEVTDADVETQIENDLSQNLVEVKDADAVVKEGDTVNINYVGKKDGVAFDGGTADDYDLNIGSGTFIDGFEDGLIGCKKGDTVDLNLTFPENYSAEDLAGADVVFTVTINAIKEAPELTDEWVKENLEYDSVDAYRQEVRKQLTEYNQESAKNLAMNDAWEKVLKNAKITDYPEKDMEAAKKYYDDMLDTYAKQSDMTVDEFLEMQQMTREDFDKQAQESSKSRVKQNLVVQAIMDAEGFSPSDEDQKKAEQELASSFGADDLSSLREEYGEDYINELVAYTRVSKFVLDNANVDTVIATDDNKQGIDMGEEEE